MNESRTDPTPQETESARVAMEEILRKLGLTEKESMIAQLAVLPITALAARSLDQTAKIVGMLKPGDVRMPLVLAGALSACLSALDSCVKTYGADLQTDRKL